MDDEMYIIGHPAYQDEPVLCLDCDGLGYTESTYIYEETDEIIIENTPCCTCGGTGIMPDDERDWDEDRL